MSEPQDIPIVTIGIPCYNRAEGLERTINNLINQSYKNIEILISDNCSTNPEVEKVGVNYKKLDERIVYIRQSTNIGMYANFQYVLEQATGKYFMWASDDDEWDPDHIKNCIQPLEEDERLVLCAPICKVYNDLQEEIMPFKPDFHTVGMNKIERIRKIAFYIKKSHGAMYGLFRTKVLQNIKVHTYLDCDGLLLLELSQYGSFYMLNEHLVTAHISTSNKESESLTFQKEKLIDAYHMKPKFLLMKFENTTVFGYFLLKSLKWPKLNFTDHFKVISILYRSFFGYNTFKPLNLFRNLIFLLKKKKIVLHFSVDSLETIDANLETLLPHVEKVMVSYPENNVDETKLAGLKKKYGDKVIFFGRFFYTRHAELQYGLDYIKEHHPDLTHFLIYKPEMNFSEDHIKSLKAYIQQRKFFNRGLTIEMSNTGKEQSKKLILVPIRNYISFKDDNRITAGVLNATLN